MALKDNWQDLVDGESEVNAKPINDIAAAVIKLEETSSGGLPITIDSKMSDTSENPVQNKVTKQYIDGLHEGLAETMATKQDLKSFVPLGKYMQDIGNIETLLGGI